ncbi:Tigger transposable element-derived protein 6, partial [Dictyocoela muelleri]
RNILLILDNAPCHDKNLKFKNIELCFLPPKSTAFFQPLDAGIIRSFKASFKKFLLRHVLFEYENGKLVNECFSNINIKNAIIYSKWAWDSVSVKTIENCWKKSSLIQNNNSIIEFSDEFEILNENQSIHEITVVNENLDEIISIIGEVFNDENIKINDYINCDDDIDNNETDDFSNSVEIENSYSDFSNDELFVNESELFEDDKFVAITFESAYKAYKIFEEYILQNEAKEKTVNMLKIANDFMFDQKNKNKT